MNMYINVDAISELERMHLSASHLILLDFLYHNEKIEILNKFPEVLYQTLRRKNLISENNDSITESGKLLYETLINPFYNSTIDVKKEIKKVRGNYPTQFVEWWNTYPIGDQWEENGRHFKGTRAFKVKKDECAVKYIKLLETISHEDLMLAIQYETFLKKKDSLRTGVNKLSFIQNTATYLNQQSYIGMIEMAKQANWKPQTQQSKILFEEKSKESFQL